MQRGQFDPVAGRHMQPLGGRGKIPGTHSSAVIGRDGESAGHSHEELVAGPVRMPAPGDAGAEFEKMEFPANLERQLLPGFRKSQHSTLVTT